MHQCRLCGDFAGKLELCCNCWPIVWGDSEPSEYAEETATKILISH
jgi:hypothetical protein